MYGKRSGDVIKGKNAAYKIKRISKCYCMIRNVNIADTVYFGESEELNFVSKKNEEKIKEVVSKSIQPENIPLPQRWWDSLFLCFTLNEDFNIENVTFGFGVKEYSSVFWCHLPVDCYHAIEEALMKLELSFDEKEKEVIRGLDFEHGACCCCFIGNEDVCKYWNIEMRKLTKEDKREVQEEKMNE